METKPVRVLHISSEKDWRGGEQQIAYLVEELNKTGVTNIVVCARNSKFEELCLKEGWNHISAGFSSFLILGTAREVARICRINKIGILHLHTSTSHTVGVLSTLFGHKAQLILTRRVDNPVGRNILSKWKYNHPRIKKIITVSDKIRQVVAAAIKNPGITKTIHSGIDIHKFEAQKKNRILRDQYQLNDDEILVGNTSAIANHKDYHTFVDTCEWVLRHGLKTRFIIIGKGPEEQDIRSYIASKNLDSKIILAGFRNDVASILPGLNIFLMTSKTEGLGTSILDAFASYVPVVATRGGGIPEMVKDGETGLLADPGDFEKLGENILRLSADKILQKKITDNAYQLLKEEFTCEIMAEKVLDTYKEVLE